MFGILKIIGLIFLILIAIVLILVFIIYNFASLDIASVCISENGMQTNLSCSLKDDCTEFLKNNLGSSNEIPSVLNENINNLINQATSCNNGFCEVKNISLIKNSGLIKDKFEGDIPLTDNCDGNKYDVRLKIKEIVRIIREISNK